MEAQSSLFTILRGLHQVLCSLLTKRYWQQQFLRDCFEGEQQETRALREKVWN